MPDVKEAVDPKQLANNDKTEQARFSAHRHLLDECHVKNTSGHAAEWWKKAHASAIQAMPEEIKCHDAVKGQVGTTLWDIAHASLESQGQKGSIAHEMKRIADLNHISVDCSDLRGKEIRLHDHHTKVVEAPVAPLPPPRPVEAAVAPLPPRRPAEAPLPLPEPRVIMAPNYGGDQRQLAPLPPRDGYDVQSGLVMPVERCHQPNILDLFNPLARRDMECRMPPRDGNFEYYHRDRRGYDNEGQFGIGQLFGGRQFQPEQYHHYRERAGSVVVGRGAVVQEAPVQVAPMHMRTQQTMHRYSSGQTTMTQENCPPGQMMGRNGVAHKR